MSVCIDKIHICAIRGDTFALDVGLSGAAIEVVDDPAAYMGNLVFREAQDDTLTPYLTLTASVEPVDPLTLPVVPPTGASLVYMYFTATAAQTQTLPAWDHVAYCEIIPIVQSAPTRLFNADVQVAD